MILQETEKDKEIKSWKTAQVKEVKFPLLCQGYHGNLSKHLP